MTLLLFLLIFIFPEPGETGREHLIQRACELRPELSFCKNSENSEIIENEAKKKENVFLSWVFVAAKDARDIEDTDTDELESSQKGVENVDNYCAKYSNNFKSYCTSGKLERLEGLLAKFCASYKRNCDISGEIEVEDTFPTPTPFLENSEKEQEMSKTTTESSIKKDSLEELELPSEENSLEEIDSKEFETSSSDSKTTTPLPETKNDEVSQYCNNYSENYNYFCVGDMSPEHEKFCTSYKTNCPDKVPLKGSGTFLGEKGSDSESGSSDKSLFLYRGNKKEYCDKFSVNYEYYCKGTIEDVKIFTKFCPSYKKACLNDAPENPFEKTKGTAAPSQNVDDAFPDLDNPEAGKPAKGKHKRVKKKRDCTADCDEKIYPHCTKDCKCDFAYPQVQKFCNPPPLPLFLNTCRLWYYGCPKYEQYHYASQFVYSKAEKGKVLEGPKLSTTFQLLTPTGETLPYKPTRTRRDTGFVEWPEQTTDTQLSTNTIDWTPSVQNPIEGSGESEDDPEEPLTKIVADPKRNGALLHLVPAPPLPKKLVARDDALSDQNSPEDRNEQPPNLPRAKKTTGGESVPVFSDSVFSSALNQYNTFTDSRGILHRPRSRSPFTKPGLWEPNPDDPHNRDHANKYYYHPESVNIDWLQGQLAWGAHWAVPAAGVGGTDGFSALHFPSIGTFLNIPDDYD